MDRPYQGDQTPSVRSAMLATATRPEAEHYTLLSREECGSEEHHACRALLGYCPWCEPATAFGA